MVLNLARAGWNVAFTCWTPYDARMHWGMEPGAPEELHNKVTSLGARTLAAEADLSDPAVPAQLFDSVERELGNVTDTGWMTEEQKADMIGAARLGRLGVPQDCANLVTFLCSAEGGRINAQLLQSNGGFT